jgi:hypothetical protein
MSLDYGFLTQPQHLNDTSDESLLACSSYIFS